MLCTQQPRPIALGEPFKAAAMPSKVFSETLPALKYYYCDIVPELKSLSKGTDKEKLWNKNKNKIEMLVMGQMIQAWEMVNMLDSMLTNNMRPCIVFRAV